MTHTQQALEMYKEGLCKQDTQCAACFISRRVCLGLVSCLGGLNEFRAKATEYLVAHEAELFEELL